MHEKVKGKKEAYIWGAAAYGLAALEYCKDKFKIVGFIDKRADLQFKEFADCQLYHHYHFCVMRIEIIELLLSQLDIRQK